MSDQPVPSQELIADVRFALDNRQECALGLRDALLRHYKAWPQDRLLGPPFELGLADRQDPLDSLVARVVSSGGASRHLEGVRQAGADLDHLALSYKDGVVAGSTVGTWRADVERLYAKLASALEATDAWLAGWGRRTPSKPPNLAILEQQELLSTEDLAAVLGIGTEQASRRRQSGEFGEVVGKGRRKFVKSSEVRRALGL